MLKWQKELAPYSNSKAQIRRLKEILHDLGMDGKLTSNKAKAIKEAREFERDIQDTQKDANDFIARREKVCYLTCFLLLSIIASRYRLLLPARR